MVSLKTPSAVTQHHNDQKVAFLLLFQTHSSLKRPLYVYYTSKLSANNYALKTVFSRHLYSNPFLLNAPFTFYEYFIAFDGA